MHKPIPLSQPFLSNVETSYVASAVESGWLTQSGAFVLKMEEVLSEVFFSKETAREVTTTSNGTTALHLSLLAMNIGPGDEVIVPNFGYIAPVNAVLMCKATPVVVDVNLNDWCIDPELVVNAVSDRTKAIIAIDNYGVFANISEIRAKVSKDVLIIQDAAETFPSNFYSGENRFQGDLVTTSFYANKVITSAEGGAICGPSDLIRKITSLKNQSLKSKGIFEHVDIGYNYRISNLHAALFAAQWERISEILERRNLVFKTYFEYLVEFGVDFVSSQFPNYVNPWLMTIRLPGQSDKMTSLRVKLQDIGIETRPGFKTLSTHEYLDEFIKIKSDLEVSNTISKEIISLPTYPELGEKSISFICKSLANLTK